MKNQSIRKVPGGTRNAVLGLLVAAGVVACGGSSSSAPPAPPPPPPPPPAALAIAGVVTDGPVSGGTLFVFSAEQVLPALASIDPAGDRLAALNAAASVASVARDPADGDQFSLSVPGDFANEPLFFVFDNTGADDEAFSDSPPNLESVAMAGAAGSSQRVNVSLQTTLIARQVRAMLDPDNDGTNIDDTAIAAAIGDAINNVLAGVSQDSLGRDLYPVDFDPVSHPDDDEVHRASAVLGALLRSTAFIASASFDELLEAMAADTTDGDLDGNIPANLQPTPELEALAQAVADLEAAGSDEDISMYAVGPCSSAAVSLQQACSVDLLDDLFEFAAVCNDIADNDDRAACLQNGSVDLAEKEEECDAVFEARLSLCEDLADAAHEPMFGPAFAGNFVDPLEIGNTVVPNPWFPLVTGNRWEYAGIDESIDVEVTGETKLIDGVTCVVVVDIATAEGVVVEITRDWYAQDVAGNVWYCGEIARNFEVFDGDNPETPELVDIDGSWKAGRDGAEPGILLPFAPQPDDVIRQEVAYGEAEDVIRIDSVTASETSPGGSCNSTCLKTTDFTPLDPDVEENKYYLPGTGLIVEIDVETGDRVELIEFTSAP